MGMYFNLNFNFKNMNCKNTESYVLPEKIRSNLSRYEKHDTGLCLHCGYSGLMGVHKTERKNNRSKTIAIGLSIFSLFILLDISSQMANRETIAWWIYGIAGICLAFYDSRKKIYLACANCNAEIIQKS